MAVPSTSETLHLEADSLRWWRQLAVYRRKFVEAVLLTIRMDLLDRQQMLSDYDRQGSTSGAEIFLEELRHEAAQAMLSGANPVLALNLLLEVPSKQLRCMLNEFGLSGKGCIEKRDLVERLGWRSDRLFEDSDEEVIDLPEFLHGNQSIGPAGQVSGDFR
mmetsp:Transcript_87213/g.279607  ORF Transcript_87213/g.279607 Transcript_87213/m.279607 type:complete len:161 (-) Transcript_87213:91-573(-)